MKTVKIFNFETWKTTEIPAAELAPNMIRANVESVGEVWIDSSKVQMASQYKHPPFNGEMKELMRMFKAKLDEVYPMTVEQWEDGFRKDANMERELEQWANIANAYGYFGANAPKHQRKEVFNIILSIYNNGPDTALECVRLNNVPRAQAEQIVDHWRKGNS